MSPLLYFSKDPVNKALTKSELIDLAKCFVNLLQKYIELAEIVKTWPDLPEHIQAAIKALIQTYEAEKK